MYKQNNIMITFIYASCYIHEREQIWNYLCSYQTTLPWIVGGDFNNILHHHEKLGGLITEQKSIDDFQNCLHQAQLFDIGYVGDDYTWSNKSTKIHKRIWSRLDRVVINKEETIAYPQMTLYHLPKILSNHYFLHMALHNNIRYHKARFSFKKIWLKEFDNPDLIKQEWLQTYNVNPWYNLTFKLKHMKEFYLANNKININMIETTIKEMETKLTIIDQKLKVL